MNLKKTLSTDIQILDNHINFHIKFLYRNKFDIKLHKIKSEI